MVAIEVEDNILTTHTIIGLATLVIVAINYMTNLHVLLMWPSLVIPLNLRFKVRAPLSGTHLQLHLWESSLDPVNMRVIFALLKHPNLHPLLILPRLLMFLFALHTLPDLRFSSLEPLIIYLVIRSFFLLLPLHHLYSYYLS